MSTAWHIHMYAVYLFKLVYPEDAPGVPPMRPHLLSETRRYSSVLPGQILGLHPLVAMEGTDWLLVRYYQVLLLYSGILSHLTALADDLKGRLNKE